MSSQNTKRALGLTLHFLSVQGRDWNVLFWRYIFFIGNSFFCSVLKLLKLENHLRSQVGWKLLTIKRLIERSEEKPCLFVSDTKLFHSQSDISMTFFLYKIRKDKKSCFVLYE